MDHSRCESIESKLFLRERSISKSISDGGFHPDYLLFEVIGQSGMCTVWRAMQTSTGRDLAIKMVNTNSAFDQRTRDMFLRYAVLIADLDHPNIVPVYDLGRSESNELFCSMRMAKGQEWRQLIKSLTLEENLAIWSKVADAIAFAHSRGVLHCDIKPEEVIVGSCGEVQMMDFGAALVLPNFRHYALWGDQPSFNGATPAYMAPEQAKNLLVYRRQEPGAAATIGPATDIYLLGATLFEIICGKPPHSARGPEQAVMAASRNEIIEVDLPENLRGYLDIARKAMQTSPEDRYPSVKSLMEALRNCQKQSASLQLLERSAKDHETTNESKETKKSRFAFWRASK